MMKVWFSGFHGVRRRRVCSGPPDFHGFGVEIGGVELLLAWVARAEERRSMPEKLWDTYAGFTLTKISLYRDRQSSVNSTSWIN